MKRLSPSTNFVSLIVIIITFSFVNKHAVVFGKHNNVGGHHIKRSVVELGTPDPVPLIEPLPAEPLPADPGVAGPLPVVGPQPVVEPQPVVGPLPVVPLNEPKPGGPRSDTTYDIIVINQASGADTMNITCHPGNGLPGTPGLPPPDTCGPPVEPHLLRQGERFSWTFEYPDPTADISYTCIIDWTGHNQGLVPFFDKDTYTDAECKSDKGNFCYWAVAPDGFYHSNEDAPFPGPAWTYRWPWGM